MFLLIVFGIGVVFIYSVVVVILFGFFLNEVRDVYGYVFVYFEVVLVIIVLVFFG